MMLLVSLHTTRKCWSLKCPPVTEPYFRAWPSFASAGRIYILVALSGRFSVAVQCLSK